jgi:predicted nucleic acid-binding protein
MNHVFVVDASVAVKRLVYEEFTDRAQAKVYPIVKTAK